MRTRRILFTLPFLFSLGYAKVNEINSYEKEKKHIRGLQKGNENWVEEIPFKLEEAVAGSLTVDNKINRECLRDPMPWECVRFSKVSFPSGYVNTYPKTYLPLTPDDYPLQGPKSEMLKDSTCPSVVCEDDPGAKTDINSLIHSVGGAPAHPSCNEDDPFWIEFEEVVDLALVRKFEKNTPACLVMELPDLWKGWNLEQVAEAVHNEVREAMLEQNENV